MNTLIANGLIVDGSGAPPFVGDVLIADGQIAAVGRLPEVESALRIDADGRCVTPGFTDIHRHCDYAVFRDGFGEIELSQGITSVISGSCGLTPFPYAPELTDTLTPVLGDRPFALPSFRAYRDALERTARPLHVGGLIGSCAIRAAVKGMSPSPFTKKELDAARVIVREAMESGALGVSLGVMYLPDFYSTAEEMACIAGEAARYGGILTAHIRGEGNTLLSSVEEAIKVSELAEMPLEISHFKSCGPANWGRGLERAIEAIETARRNLDITVDAYPYHGGATTLLSLLPPDFPHADRGNPIAIEAALNRDYNNWDNYIKILGFENILIQGTPLSAHPNPYAFLCEVLTAEQGRTGITVMSMSPEDVDTVVRLPYASVISDALYPADTAQAHPRLFSAFPKLLRDFVRERRVLTLQDAVRKITSLPAKRMNLGKRGLLREGYAADINIFGLDNIRDRSDFTQSGLLAEGMDIVLVGGEIAWQNQKINRTVIKGRHGLFLERK